jgi:hypothetical protein
MEQSKIEGKKHDWFRETDQKSIDVFQEGNGRAAFSACLQAFPLLRSAGVPLLAFGHTLS